jgi:hypothetical protein
MNNYLETLLENKALQCKEELVECYIQAQERNYIQGKETCIKNYIRKEK